MNTVSVRTLVISACLVLIPLGAAPPRAFQDQAGVAPQVVAKFTVLKDGEPIFLPVRWQGKEYLFLLDTGLTHAAFDTSLPLGPPLETAAVRTPSGIANLNWYKPPDATIGPLPFRSEKKVMGTDFSRMRQISGYPIYGVIGMEFLASRIVQIDFDKGEVRFLQSADRTAGDPVPLTLGHDLALYVSGQTLGWNYDFLVDTGYIATGSTGWIDRSLFNIGVQSDKLKVVNSALTTDLSGDATSRLGQTSELRLGGFTISRPVLSEGSGNALALDFWARFQVTFDFPKKVVYLKKGKHFDRPDQWDRSGLHILRMDGKTVVGPVDKGSAARGTGIKTGDHIVAISRRPAAELTMIDIRRRLSVAGETLPLIIRRGDQDYQANLKLQP